MCKLVVRSGFYEELSVTTPRLRNAHFFFTRSYKIGQKPKFRQCYFLGNIKNIKIYILGHILVPVSEDPGEAAGYHPDAARLKGLTHERGHTLDLVITRQEDDLVASCDIGAFIPDHNSLHVTLNCSKTHPPRKTITYRSVSSVNVSLVGNDISSLLSHFLNNLDEAVELYNKVLLDVMDIHAPLKQCTVVDHPQHPWINESILTVKRKRKAEKKWKSSGSEISKKEYKVLCNQVKDMVKKAKDKFYAQKVHGCEGDQKKLCKIIDSFMDVESLTSYLLLHQTFFWPRI